MRMLTQIIHIPRRFAQVGFLTFPFNLHRTQAIPVSNMDSHLKNGAIQPMIPDERLCRSQDMLSEELPRHQRSVSL